MPAIKLHPLIEAAGLDGALPDWACVSDERRGHVQRVAGLLGEWSELLTIPEYDRIRWRAAGLLHDALKDAAPDDLRSQVDVDWPDPLLHAPAVSARLALEGVEDQELLLALKYHSVGHPDFGSLGQHLYLADYLEPGRPFSRKKRAALRARMPHKRAAVLSVVVKNRLIGRLEARAPVLPESLDFWNGVVAP